MSDTTRKALARLIADALVKQQGEQDWAPPAGDSVCLDGFFAQGKLADAILADPAVLDAICEYRAHQINAEQADALR